VIQEASDEIVTILAKKWGVNMQGPVPEVTAVLARVVDVRLETYRAEFVPDLPPGVEPSGLGSASGVPANPVHGKFTQL